MDPAWVMVGVAVVGVLGQWGIGKRSEGRRDEQLRTVGREIGEVKRAQSAQVQVSDRHGRQLVRIETKLNLPPIGD